MDIRSAGRTFQVPLPSPQPGELLLRVVRSELLQRPAGADESRFTFSHPMAKILFFLLREGPWLTLAKVRAARLQRRVQALRAVVIALGEGSDGQGYLAVGPQDVPAAGWLAFNADLVVRCPDCGAFEEHAGRIREHFRHHGDSLLALFHYSPFAGVLPPITLAEILAGSDPVRSREHPSSADAAVVASASASGPPTARSGKNDLFLAGAGAYAHAYILPNLKGVRRHTIIDVNPLLAAVMGKAFGFAHRECSTSAAFCRLPACPEPLLVVATYHSTHVPVAEEALSCNPGTKILLEKPPVIDDSQLGRLLEMRRGGAFIEIGYNRRHAPMAVEAARLVRAKGGAPVVMTCMVKELALPPSHWYYWPSQGTRITGNLCHWIDLGTFIIDAEPTEVTVVPAINARPGDELTVVVSYGDGSRLTLVTTDQGNPLRGVQEQIDIRRGDLTVTIDDFLVMTVKEGGGCRVWRPLIRDKGHARMYRDFSRRVRSGALHFYPDRDLLVSSLIYLAVVEGARMGGGRIPLPVLVLDHPCR